MYTLDKDGRMARVAWPDVVTTAELPFGVAHVMASPLTETLTLLLDTFNESVEIVDTRLANKLLEEQTSLSASQLAYFRSRFALEQWLPGAKARYAAAKTTMEAEVPRVLAIVPSYDCNMRCTYCYQQHDRSLDRTAMTSLELQVVFEYLRREISIARTAARHRPIVIELFGGEPFLPPNKALIRTIFEFARANQCHLSATSNGLEVDQFYDILAPYHGYLSTMNITLDGRMATHEKRRLSRRGAGSFDRIVRCINNLLRLKVRVSIGLNIDRMNVDELEPFLDIAAEHSWIDNPNVILDIGRVDDRKHDIPYARREVILTEAELLERVLAMHDSAALPSNLRLSFLKTTFALTQRLGLSFGHNEFGRLPYHYCWATSPGFSAEYLDRSGRIYRCTYTVGDPRWASGDVNTGPDMASWFSHNLFSLPECLQCPLGGFCSGGCRLSALTDPTRRCQGERRSWDIFVDRIVAPRLRAMLAHAEDR